MSRQKKLVMLVVSIALVAIAIVGLIVWGKREEQGTKDLSPNKENTESNNEIEFDNLDDDVTHTDYAEPNGDVIVKDENSNIIDNQRNEKNDTEDNDTATPEKDVEEDRFETIEDTDKGYGPIN